MTTMAARILTSPPAMARSTGRNGAGRSNRLAMAGRFFWSAFASSATTRQAIGLKCLAGLVGGSHASPPRS